MEVIIVNSETELAHEAADAVARLVTNRPRAVIGVATGSSPQGVYRDLAGRVFRSELSFEHVRAFALDEYVGLPRAHAESYSSVISRDIVEPLGFDPDLVLVPDGIDLDTDASTGRFERSIAEAGGIDLQLLGIGTNGHIGFNEPTSSFASRTRIKTLAPQTRRDNARFFDSQDDVPTHCITQGLGTILEAQRLVLVAHGASKALAVARAVEGPVSSMWPGSLLQLHRFATVIVDEAAASQLALGEYYRYTRANKPDRLGFPAQ